MPGETGLSPVRSALTDMIPAFHIEERSEYLHMTHRFLPNESRQIGKTILNVIVLTFALAVLLAGFAAGRAAADEQNLPYADRYIDLHLHLDGAITLDIAKQLAALQGFTLPDAPDEELEKYLTVPDDCESLNDFLKCFELPGYLLQTPEGLREAVHLVADNIRNQGVLYAEIRFAPQFHTKSGMTQEEAVQAALEGLKETELKANLILCCMRGEGNEAQNEETLALAKKYLVEDGGVVAMDLAGAEALYPTENYRELFAKAKELGVPFTMHAGEAAGPESVRHAIEYGASRIGHGVRIFEDPELVAMVREKGIALEMCPTSNRQTHAVEDMADYPFMQFLEDGIRVTLNTDDMGIEGTTLAKEFRYMEETFALSPEQERIVLANAVDAAFTTDEVKDRLREQLGLPKGMVIELLEDTLAEAS